MHVSHFSGAENKEKRYLSWNHHDPEEFQWGTEPSFHRDFGLPLSGNLSTIIYKLQHSQSDLKFCFVTTRLSTLRIFELQPTIIYYLPDGSHCWARNERERKKRNINFASDHVDNGEGWSDWADWEEILNEKKSGGKRYSCKPVFYRPTLAYMQHGSTGWSEADWLTAINCFLTWAL